MSQIKPSTHGIVVEHKESGVRYAVSDANYNPDVHRKVRDLRPGETVWSYQPRAKAPLGGAQASEDANPSGAGTPSAAGDQEVAQNDPGTDSQTEGAAAAATKGK